jgi:hypothetical protein
LASKPHSDSKVLVYISDNDVNFDELVDTMLSESHDNFIFLVDFTTENSWRETMDKHPSIIHFGCRYYKAPQNTCKLDLAPEHFKQLDYWLTQIERD